MQPLVTILNKTGRLRGCIAAKKNSLRVQLLGRTHWLAALLRVIQGFLASFILRLEWVHQCWYFVRNQFFQAMQLLSDLPLTMHLRLEMANQRFVVNSLHEKNKSLAHVLGDLRMAKGVLVARTKFSHRLRLNTRAPVMYCVAGERTLFRKQFDSKADIVSTIRRLPFY